MSAALIRKIHVGCRKLGINDDTRHDLTLQVVGKESLRDCSDAELTAVVDALKQRGFRDGPAKGKKYRPFASRGDVRFAHVLWGKLVNAGVMVTPGPTGLNAFIRARFESNWGAVPLDVDQMRDWKQIASVIEALKAICAREGIGLETK